MAIDQANEKVINMAKAARLSDRCVPTLTRWRNRGLVSRKNHLKFFLEWSQNGGVIVTSIEALERLKRRILSERDGLSEEDIKHSSL